MTPIVRLALVQQRDGDAEMGNAAGEVRGAVDGIDHPGRHADAAILPFLTEERVLGKPPFDSTTNQPLDVAIRLRQVILWPLEVELPAIPGEKQVSRAVSRLAGHVTGKLEPGFEIDHREPSGLVRGTCSDSFRPRRRRRSDRVDARRSHAVAVP